MKKNQIENSCYVKIENGVQFIYTPDGIRIPHTISSQVIDEVDKIPIAIIKLFVNLEPNE